jgi:hypothetical protein
MLVAEEDALDVAVVVNVAYFVITPCRDQNADHDTERDSENSG